MAPPPEYDKEPKAPDKSVTNNLVDDSKLVYNHIKDQSANTEHKTTAASANVDVENNKHVETLDDGQLRALLDEAITYKCPKDREGKSSLFKELLEEVEQDEQACEAAARLGAGRNTRRGRARREHHSSLQDLVAAMAGETAPRRGRGHAAHAPAPPAGTVSARALHGGSLPSGVDTSFLLGEEASVTRGGYLATVRCVNPPPLAERRVSTGDASPPPPQPAHDLDALTRRSKPMFPMTYTARATLEIGSGSVCSGRAVTTTTASNQVRTASPDPRTPTPAPPHASRQARLMRALRVAAQPRAGGGGPRGPASAPATRLQPAASKSKAEQQNDALWVNKVNNWYQGLNRYSYGASTSYDSVTALASQRGEIGMRTNLSLRSQTLTPALTTKLPGLSDISMQMCKSNLLNSDENKTVIKCDKDRDFYNDFESDFISKRRYREMVGYLEAPSKTREIKRNFRSLTIGKPHPTTNETCKDNTKNNRIHKNTITDKKSVKINEVNRKLPLKKPVGEYDTGNQSTPSFVEKPSSRSEIVENDKTLSVDIQNSDSVETSKTKTDFELVDIPFNSKAIEDSNSFTEYVANQKNLINKLEINNNEDKCYTNTDMDNESFLPSIKEIVCEIKYQKVDKQMNIETIEHVVNLTEAKVSKNDINTISTSTIQSVVAELPNNANILITYPKSFLTNHYAKNKSPLKVKEAVSEVNSTNAAVDCNKNKHTKKNKKKSKQPQASVCAKKEGMNKNALKMLLYSDSREKTDCIKKKLSPFMDKEVDSSIPFSCITTPEVVASCNTTSSTSQSAVAVDPKSLQLVSSYRAVACLMDEAGARPASPPPLAAGAHSASPDRQQPRGAASGAHNGLPLTRPAAADEYKKSLDENGNAVQGFGSPLSGSGQHKKPRRKKSSKNETVITSHQIDGYQGNKDLNEVLRFIESNAEGARAPKLRAKHKDDGDDKAAKKRSAERRKDKDKPKRASSLEELSRTTLADLTDKREPAKPERRSWGDDARALLEPDPPPELADFQTVTKKRKPRRRADEPERAPSPPPRRLQRRHGLRALAAARARRAARQRVLRRHRAHAPQHPRPHRVVQLLRRGRAARAARARRAARPVPGAGGAAPRQAARAAQGAARARRGGGPAPARRAAGGGRGRGRARHGRRHVRLRRERAAAGRALRPAGARRRARARRLRRAALRAAAAAARPHAAPDRRLRGHSVGGRDARRRQGALLQRVRGARRLAAADDSYDSCFKVNVRKFRCECGQYKCYVKACKFTV